MDKTLIQFDYSVLKGYSAFDKVNKDWNILSYLNHRYDANAALAFSKFYFPDFVEVRGCIVLSFLYNQETFDSWFKELKGEVAQVEKMANLYELKDYFHINSDDQVNLDSLGQVLKRCWEINLSLLYPDRSVQVNTFEEYGSKFITLHTINA